MPRCEGSPLPVLSAGIALAGRQAPGGEWQSRPQRQPSPRPDAMGLLHGLGVLAGEPHGRMVALAGKGHPRAASSGPASPEACMGDAALGSSNVLAGREPASPALGAV